MTITRRMQAGPGPRRGFWRKRTIEGEESTVAVKRVTITSPAPPNLEPTQTHQVAVLVEGYNETEEVGSYFELTGETVRYFSSNSSVFTVDNSGLITGVGAGTATLIVDVDGYRATQSIVVTNPQSAVASVEIVEGTGAISLSEGQQITRQARAKDASGNVLVGKVVSWSSSDSGKATVSADSGDENHQTTIVAVDETDPSPTIKATCEGVDSPSITVDITAATDYTNEPAGYTQIVSHSFGTISGWDNATNGWSTVQVSTDATDPKSPSDVVQHTYPAGTSGGPYPGRMFWFPAPMKELYICAWVKHSSPWTVNPGGDKLWLVNSNQNPSTVNEIVFGIKAGSTKYLSFSIQNPGSINYLTPNVNATPYTFGGWHKLEYVLKRSTGGLANGEVHWWLDGVKQGAFTNQRYHSTGDGTMLSLYWQHYWGGSVSTKAQTEFISDGHLYISGLAA